MNKILVTTALPYANGPIHLGHLAGCYLPADVYVRYQKLRGRECIHIGGTDENGVPITIKAEAISKTPYEVATYYHNEIKKDFKKIGILFDHFGRTSSQCHHKLTQDFFLNLYKVGYIESKSVSQFFCIACKRFLPDRYIEGICQYCSSPSARGDQCDECGKWIEPRELKNPRCKLCGADPILKETKHWFFKLDILQDRLEGWLREKKSWRENVREFALGWVKEGLKPRPITRDLSWGVPVPLKEAEGKLIYVWFEAPIGYISSTMEWADLNQIDWRDWWTGDTRLVHFIGKDNIVFHAIMWPATLMAYGDLILPSDIPANEFLTIERRQMSTSRNYAIWLSDFLREFEPDPLRYALLSNAPESSDSDFTWDDFGMKNNELVGTLGNLINRTLKFTEKYMGGRIREKGRLLEVDNKVFNKLNECKREIEKAYENFSPKKATEIFMELAREGNRYFDHTRPWELKKSDPDRLSTVIWVVSSIIANLSIMAEPVLPFTSEKIRNLLSTVDKGWDDIGEGMPGQGVKIEGAKILFTPLSREKINLERRKMMSGMIKIDQFSILDIRVAKVESAERIEGTERLIRLLVDTGGDMRQIVAGIGEFYKPEELVGKKIVVLLNLEPMKIRGVESKGMLLAADVNGKAVLLTVDSDVPDGSNVR
ncbi:methionine--tRNA ligase [candidate division WOR-3 bacterium]|nr:methionine--tRNA ligase [candidate division WOR-3 bacterium]